MAVDPAKLEQFMGRIVGDMGSAISAALVVIGDQLGLYKAMAGAEPLTPAELAARTGTAERYVREWLCAQAAGGYVDYDASSGRFRLNDEQTMVFADEQSPVFAQGGFQVLTALFKDEPKITAAFRSGKGVGWHEHDPALFVGTERFFRPNYNANLTSSWIPALEGVEQKLRAGARVADVGCGLGTSTVIMARTYPRSTFVGFDYHEPSIVRARAAAAEAGVGDRARFEVSRAQDYPGTRGRERGGRGRPRSVRGGARARLSRHGVRSGRALRLPARHGRSGWCRRARAPVARAGRHLDAGRALRR